jgi:hypothetical protein
VCCAEGSPFANPVLTTSAFLAVFCPMVKTLSLCSITVLINPTHFAAICGLSNLKELRISGDEDEYDYKVSHIP